MYIIIAWKDNKYKCPLCKAKFKDKEVLSNHFASHKFCHVCGKSFGVGNKCDRDFLRHVKKCGKSHTCSRCGAEFPYKSYLVRHQEKSKCANNECKQTAADNNDQNVNIIDPLSHVMTSVLPTSQKFREIESGDEEISSKDSVKSETFDDIASAEINDSSHATSHENITDQTNTSDYIDHVTGLVSSQTIVLNNPLPITTFQSNLKSTQNTFLNTCDESKNIQAENNTIFEPGIKME